MSEQFNVLKTLESITYQPQLNLVVQMFEDEQHGLGEVYRGRFIINDKMYLFLDNDKAKTVIGPDYNYIFLKKNGFFQRWGATPVEDPQYSPIGPEILDLEISVNGCPPVGNGGNCKFCYKGNTNKPPTNMDLETFKSIINKIPKTLTQVAFGITGIQTNPDFIPMMEYCRELGIVPNFTLSGADLTDEIAKKVSEVSGAVAVSVYESDKNVGYDTIKTFTDLGMTQINIHAMVSQETLDFVYEILKDMKEDERLSKMHAIVFLGVKPKGRAADNYHSLTSEQYGALVKYCLDQKLNFGFDSCSAPKFEHAIKNMEITNEMLKQLVEASESCESSIFSSYINVYGEYWHCSFTEEEDGHEFVDVMQTDDFITDVWYSEPVKLFRKKLIDTSVDGCRSCHVFPSINPTDVIEVED